MCRPFGDPHWVKDAAKRLGLECTVRPRGRPKKQSEAGQVYLFSLCSPDLVAVTFHLGKEVGQALQPGPQCLSFARGNGVINEAGCWDDLVGMTLGPSRYDIGAIHVAQVPESGWPRPRPITPHNDRSDGRCIPKALDMLREGGDLELYPLPKRGGLIEDLLTTVLYRVRPAGDLLE